MALRRRRGGATVLRLRFGVRFCVVLCGFVWRGGYGYGVWGLVVGVAGW